MLKQSAPGNYKNTGLIITLFLAVALMGIQPAVSQIWKTKPFSVGVFNNATLPFPESATAVFNEPLHPGVELNYEFGWKETIKSPMFRNINTYALGGKQVLTGKWFQNVAVSWYYHEYVNHVFAYTTKGGYRKYLGKFTFEVNLHAGMLHGIELTERSVQNGKGGWKSQPGPGRLYLAAGAGTGIGYDGGYRYNVRRVFLNYDYRIQLPFSSGYVKVLPNGLLTLGMQFTLFKNTDLQGNSNKDRLECPE